MFKIGFSSTRDICTRNCVSDVRIPRRRFCSTRIRELRSLLEDYSTRNNITATDWYKVNIKTLDEKPSQLLKEEFRGSLFDALSTVYPTVKWYPWKFKHQNVPLGYWSEIANQKKFFDELAEQIGIKNLDDWYGVLSKRLLMEYGGGGLLDKYNGSPHAALMSVFPEHKWILSKFSHRPKKNWNDEAVRKSQKRNHNEKLRYGHWKDLSHQRTFFDELGKKLQVNQMDDWYQKLSSTIVIKNGGAAVLERHSGSAINALMAVYPEHSWTPWKFHAVPAGYWNSIENQTKYFDWLGEHLGISKLEDWYSKLSCKVLTQNHGSTLLRMYRGSASAALMAAYPNFSWIPWNFHTVPFGFWQDPANQRKFFEYVRTKHGIQSLDDWYEKLTGKLINDNNGGGLLKLHKGSPITALMAAYPEHKWLAWKFKKELSGMWSSQDNITGFLSDLSQKLSIQTLDDWYRVDWVQLKQFGASTLLSKSRGLHDILKQQYPQHPWDPKRFLQGGKKAQRWLVVTLKKLFPDEGTFWLRIVINIPEILEDYIHPKAISPSSKRPMQLDVFIPSKSLAFEYQGEQHFQKVRVFSPTHTYQQRDEEKRLLCATNNIKLIEVPYWWNRKEETLKEMINS